MSLNCGLKEEDLIFRKRIHGRVFITDETGVKHLISLRRSYLDLRMANKIEEDIERLVESGQGLWKDLTEEEAAAWIAEQNEARPWWKKLLTCFASRGVVL